MIGIWSTHKSKALVEDAVEVLERDGSSAFDALNEPPWRDGEHYLLFSDTMASCCFILFP